MNKRIVLIDREETPNFCVYFSYGLGDKIYITQDLENMDESSRRQILDVGPGDGVLLVGGEPFKYLRQYYHFGIRSENYFDCSFMIFLYILKLRSELTVKKLFFGNNI
jgi:hypothetical protein